KEHEGLDEPFRASDLRPGIEVPASAGKLSAIAAHGEIRQAVHRLGKFKWDGYGIEPDIFLHHEMQMRAGAVAGIAGFGEQVPCPHPLTFADLHRALLEMQIHAHGAVV